jgi:hypothetical protein
MKSFKDFQLDEAISWQSASKVVAKSTAKAQGEYFNKFPERVEWFKKNHPEMAHFTSGLSVKKAGMAPKVDPAKKAAAEKISNSAYGATRGVSMGGDHGSGQKEPIAPKPVATSKPSAASKPATKPATTAPAKTPMTSQDRLKLIAAKFKSSAKQKDVQRSFKQKMSGQVSTLSHGGYEDRYDEPSHGFRHYSEEVVTEGFDDHKEIAKELVKRHGKSVTKQHIKDFESERDSRQSLDRDEIMAHVKKMSEDVEQVDEMMTDYDKRRRAQQQDPREGNPENRKRQPKNPQNDYFAQRKKQKANEEKELPMAEETKYKEKMNFVDKSKAHEVHKALKSGDNMGPAFGYKIKHSHTHLKKTYGPSWRQKAGINEEVEELEEGRMKDIETERQETERLKKAHEKKEDMKEQVDQVDEASMVGMPFTKAEQERLAKLDAKRKEEQKAKKDVKEEAEQVDEASEQSKMNKVRKGLEAQHVGKVASWKNPEELKAAKAKNPKMNLSNLYKKIGRKAWNA